MTVFVICRVLNPVAMRAVIQKAFPGENIELQDDEWLVSSSGTAQDVSDRLGITVNGQLPKESVVDAAMVLAVSGYFGRAATQIWDWIKAKMERPGG